MSKWFFYSILTVLIFGTWGVIPKAASATLSPPLIQVISTLGLVPVAVLFSVRRIATPQSNLRRGTAYAFITGLFGNSGNLALLEALKRGGEASAVYPLTGMFPLVTVLLARLFLKEKPNWAQGVGIGLAAAAIYLFSVNPEETVRVARDAVVPWWKNLVSVWMAYSLIALVLFGICGVTLKLSTRHISTELSTLCWSAASLPIAGAILLTQPLGWNISGKDWFLAIAWGALIGFGMLASYAAYRVGKASIVTALTALYPALTVVLAVPLFGEHLDMRKLAAIVLALGAGVALSYEREPVV